MGMKARVLLAFTASVVAAAALSERSGPARVRSDERAGRPRRAGAAGHAAGVAPRGRAQYQRGGSPVLADEQHGLGAGRRDAHCVRRRLVHLGAPARRSRGPGPGSAQNDCLGATQALVVIRDWLYKGSHAHDCAFAPDGFPQVSNASGTVVAHHLLDQSLANGTLGHWTPDTNGNQLGPRAMATDGTQLFVGGDFTSVNRRLQQGFARFGAGPDLARPGRPAAPKVISTSKGADSVTFTAISTHDVGTLSYRIYRDRRKAPIATLTATSWPWALPVLHFRDAGLRPGSRHTYQVAVSDGTSTSAKSAASARVTVAARSPR